jgi:hypothetical protein
MVREAACIAEAISSSLRPPLETLRQHFVEMVMSADAPQTCDFMISVHNHPLAI